MDPRTSRVPLTTHERRRETADLITDPLDRPFADLGSNFKTAATRPYKTHLQRYYHSRDEDAHAGDLHPGALVARPPVDLGYEPRERAHEQHVHGHDGVEEGCHLLPLEREEALDERVLQQVLLAEVVAALQDGVNDPHLASYLPYWLLALHSAAAALTLTGQRYSRAVLGLNAGTRTTVNTSPSRMACQ